MEHLDIIDQCKAKIAETKAAMKKFKEIASVHKEEVQQTTAPVKDLLAQLKTLKQAAATAAVSADLAGNTNAAKLATKAALTVGESIDVSLCALMAGDAACYARNAALMKVNETAVDAFFSADVNNAPDLSSARNKANKAAVLAVAALAESYANEASATL